MKKDINLKNINIREIGPGGFKLMDLDVTAERTFHTGGKPLLPLFG